MPGEEQSRPAAACVHSVANSVATLVRKVLLRQGVLSGPAPHRRRELAVCTPVGSSQAGRRGRHSGRHSFKRRRQPKGAGKSG